MTARIIGFLFAFPSGIAGIWLARHQDYSLFVPFVAVLGLIGIGFGLWSWSASARADS